MILSSAQFSKALLKKRHKHQQGIVNHGRAVNCQRQGFRHTPQIQQLGLTQQACRDKQVVQAGQSAVGKVAQFIRDSEVIHSRWAMIIIVVIVGSDLIQQSAIPFAVVRDHQASIVAFTILALAVVDILRFRNFLQNQSANQDKSVYPGDSFDIFGVTKASQQGSPPGAGVFSSWLGGPIGWLAGGWWWQQRELSKGQLDDLKMKELQNGRLAFVACVGCLTSLLLTGKGPVQLLSSHVQQPVTNNVITVVDQYVQRNVNE